MVAEENFHPELKLYHGKLLDTFTELIWKKTFEKIDLISTIIVIKPPQ